MKIERKKQLLPGALLLAACLALFGCGGEAGNTASSGGADPAGSAAREVTDDLGRRVKIPAKVGRAVSLAPNLTEIVFAVGAGDRLVGVTTYCDYPAEARGIRKIGDTLNPNLETIVALRPQVILVSTASQLESFMRTLEEQGIAVFVTNPQDVEGVYRTIFQVGEIFDKSPKAAETVDELKRRVAHVEAKTAAAPGVRVFVQISQEPLFTVGQSSFMTDLINRAGGQSVTAQVAEAYPKFSKETARALEPEAIILSDSEDNRAPNEVFRDSPAVKNGRVFRVDADLLSRPGPRMVEALEQLARSLHPESF